jgi:ABC-type transporter MlaC component
MLRLVKAQQRGLMRKIILGFLVSMQMSAFAATPNEALSETIKNLMTIIQVNNQTQRVAQLCRLVRNSVDLAAISNELLGQNFSTMARDASGIKQFNALMPSIIVTDFYGAVSDKAGAAYSVDSTPIAKGSSKVGYRVNVGGTVLTITVSKKNSKILDVEWNNFSLIQTKRDAFQRDLQNYWNTDNFHSLPVTELVKQLINSGSLIRCN